jgi:histidinol phosphatase-like PHP family hydrolase
LRGDLQMHSRWSEGSGTIVEMADAARERSYEYIAITDHSKGLKIADGIDERALRKQSTEIAKLNSSASQLGGKFTILLSLELNLNVRGRRGHVVAISISFGPSAGLVSFSAIRVTASIIIDLA